MRVLLLTVMPPSASMNGGEVLEVDLDEVVDLEAVAEEVLDGADRQRGAAERVGGVDLAAAVAGDLGLGVARDRSLRTPPRPAWMTMIVSARDGPLELSSIDAPVRASEPSTRMLRAAEHAAPARECGLGVVRHALLHLRADQEQHEREQQPAADGERHPLGHPAGGDRLARRGARRARLPVTRLSRRLSASRSPPRVSALLAGAVDLVLRRGRLRVGHRPLYIVRPCRLRE